MAENVEARLQGSLNKPVGQELSSKAALSQKLSSRIRSPLKDIANNPQETTVNAQKNAKVSVTPPGYEAIKQLDEQEGWRDRAEVVTRLDHVAYQSFAKEVVEEVVNKAISSSRSDGDLDKPKDREVAEDHVVTKPSRGNSDDAMAWTKSPQKEMTPKSDSLAGGLLLQERSLRSVPGIESLTEIFAELQLHTTRLSENPEQDEIDTTMQEEFFDSVEDMEEIRVPDKGCNLNFLDGQDIDPFKTKFSVTNCPDKMEATTNKVIETALEAVDKTESSQLGQEEVCTNNRDSDKVKATEVTVVNPSDKKKTIVSIHGEIISIDLEKTSQKEIEQKTNKSIAEDTKDEATPTAKGDAQQLPDHASPPRPSHGLQLEDAFTETSGFGLPLQEETQEEGSGVGSWSERTITEVASGSPCPSRSDVEFYKYSKTQSGNLTSEELVQDVNKEFEAPEEFFYSKEDIQEKTIPNKGYKLDFSDIFDEKATDSFKTKFSVMNFPDGKETEVVSKSIKTNHSQSDEQEQESTSNKDSDKIRSTEVAVAHPSDKKEKLIKGNSETTNTKLEKSPKKEIEQKADDSALEDTKDEAPTSKGYKMDLLSKLDDPAHPPASEVENKHIKTPDKKTSNETVQDTEDMPVPSKGYNLDFLDTLDGHDIDPFKTTSTVMNSPDKGKETRAVVMTENTQLVGQEQECIINKESDKVKGTEATAATPGDKNEILVKGNAEAANKGLEVTPQKEIEQKADDSAPEDTKDDEVPAAKGYSLNFLSKLEDPDFDPFKTKAAVANSPDEKNRAGVKSEVSQAGVTEDSSLDINTSSNKFSDMLLLDNTFIGNETTSTNGDLQFQGRSHNIDPVTDSLADKTSAEVNISACPPISEVEYKHMKTPDKKTSNEPVQDTEDMPVPSKGYNLDFLDTLDGQDTDPFKTKSAVMNSPDKKRMDPDKGKETRAVVATENTQLVGQEQECINSKESDKVKGTEATAVNPGDKNEILVKGNAKATNTDLEKTPQKEIVQKAEDSAPEDTKEDELPAAKGYSLNFLSKLDDPDFDPFKATTAVANSPDQKDKVEKTVLIDSESLKVRDSSLTEDVNSATPPASEGKKQHKAKQPGGIPSEEPAQVVSEDKTSGALEEIPVPSKGCNIDPLKTKSSLMNSPDRKEIYVGTDGKRKGADVLIAHSQVGEQKQHYKNNKETNKSKTAEDFVGNSNNRIKCSVKENVKLEENCKEKSKVADSNFSQVDVFSPFPKPRTCRPLVRDVDSPVPNTGGGQEDEFKTATDFFNNMEDIDFLSQHGTEGDKVNLARNSLYVKFDPLVGGRPSMAPYIAQQLVQRCGDEDGTTGKEGGLICFSPSPKKRMAPDQTISETTVDLSGTTLEDTVFYGGSNDTFVAGGNNTSVFNATVVDATNKTIIQQPIIGEKMVPEKEMISELKKMELIMQDKLLRKSREYKELLTPLQLELQENSVVRASLEEENSSLRTNIQQMQGIVTKIKKSYDKMMKEYKEQLETQDIKYRDQLKSEEEKHKVVCQQYMEDIEKMEGSFIDQVKKYERLREVSEILKKNNAELKTAVQDLNTQLTQKEEKFKSGIKVLEDNYAKGQQEYESLKEHYENELKKAQLIIRRSEIEMISLKETVEKKTAENKRLGNLLDEMSKY